MRKMPTIKEMKKIKLNDAINKLVRAVEDNAWKGGMHPDEAYDVEQELKAVKLKLQETIDEVIV